MFFTDLQQFSRDNRLLAFSLLLWGIGDGLFLYTQPLYLKQLGADPATIGMILAAAALAAGLAQIPAGYVADLVGRKQVILASWFIATVASVGMFLAPTLAWFVPCLVIYRFTGFVFGALNAYATTARGPQTAQRAMTLVSAGYWTGALISPAFGGWLSSLFGLQIVYGVASGVFVCSTIVILNLAPQPVLPVLRHESRYADLLNNRRFLVFVALMLICPLALQLGITFVPNYINEVYGYAPSEVSGFGSLNALGIVLFNLLLGQRPPRRSFLLAQGLVWIALVWLLLNGAWWSVGGVFFLNAGLQMTHALGLALVGRVVGPAAMGLAYGITESAFSAASVIGPLVAGQLYQTHPALPFQVSIVSIALTILLFWWLAPKRTAKESASSNPKP